MRRVTAIATGMAGEIGMSRGRGRPQAQHEMLETRAGLEPGSPLLPKPFSSESLTRKVGEVLAKRSPSTSPFARARMPKTTPRPDPWWP